MRSPSLTKTQRLFIGCVALSGIGLTFAAPASISVYLIGLFPAAVVILMYVMTRGANKLRLGGMWLGIPASILFLFATIAAVNQVQTIRSIGDLRAVRESLLDRIEIQIGQ